MIPTDFLKKLTDQLAEALPSQASTLKKDFEKNAHSILMKAFSKLDLVTREEFDAQTKVLARTREKLDALEKQLEALQQSKQ